MESFITDNVSPNIKVILEGNVVDRESKILKKHGGVYNFSIGDKFSGKVSGNKSPYVIDINLMDSNVIVGAKESLKCMKVLLNNINLISLPKLKMKNEFI